MTEARRADLVYGHLGEAVYDTDSQEWYFSRRPFTGKKTPYLRSLIIDFCRPTTQANRATIGRY